MKWFFMGAQLVAVATAQALTLGQALARAEKGNPAFQVLQAEIATAEGGKARAGIRSNPDLTIGPGVVRSTGEGATNYRWRVEMGISQTFEFPGKRELRLLAADGEVALRRIGMDGFRQNLGIQVRQAFVQALVAREIFSLRVEQAATAQAFQKAAENRQEKGYASVFELVQAQADRIASAKAVAQSKGRMKSAKLKLAQLMGTPDDTSFLVEGNLDSVLTRPEIVDPLGLALAKNPALGALSLKIELAEKAVGAAVLVSRPDLTVNPAFEFGRDEQAFAVNLSLPLPLWNRGQAEVATAGAEKRRAEGEREQFRQELSASIHAAQDRVANLREQLALYTPAFLGDLKDILARAAKVYDQSATSVLMHIEARRGYYAGMSDYYETMGELAEARSDLDAAIGVAPAETLQPDASEKP